MKLQESQSSLQALLLELGPQNPCRELRFSWGAGEDSMDFCFLSFSLFINSFPNPSIWISQDLARLGNKEEGKGFLERPHEQIPSWSSSEQPQHHCLSWNSPNSSMPWHGKELCRDKLTPWLPWNWMTGFDVTASYKNKGKNKNYLREIPNSAKFRTHQATLQLHFSPGFFTFLIFFKGKGQKCVFQIRKQKKLILKQWFVPGKGKAKVTLSSGEEQLLGTPGSSWPLHPILGTEQLSFGFYVSLELINGHSRGKLIPVLSLEDAKWIFSRRKLAILWKSKLQLPCKILLFLCLIQQLASSSRLSCSHCKNCIPVTLKCPKNTSVPSLTWVLTENKSTRANPRQAEFGFPQLQQNWGRGCFLS